MLAGEKGKMQMRACRPAGAADKAYFFTCADLLAGGDQGGVEVGISGHHAVFLFNIHHYAGCAVRTGKADDAVFQADDWPILMGAYVYAMMGSR